MLLSPHLSFAERSHPPRQLTYGLQLRRFLSGRKSVGHREVQRECKHDGLQGHASEDGDLTPGLIAMAQSWVEDVALPSFRGSAASLPSLDSWFESPQVKLYLMVRASAPSAQLSKHSCWRSQPLTPSVHLDDTFAHT